MSFAINGFTPYVPDIESWKHVFTPRTSTIGKIRVVKKVKNLGENLEPVKLVTPTAQAIVQVW